AGLGQVGLQAGLGLVSAPLGNLLPVVGVGAVVHALVQSAGEPDQDVVIFLGVVRQADPAGQVDGAVGELDLLGALYLVEDLGGIGVPGDGHINGAGHHGGDHVGHIHVEQLHIGLGQAGLGQGALQGGLGG